jgi:hypothetical protein
VLVVYLFDRNMHDPATISISLKEDEGGRTSTALNNFVQTVATPLKNCAAH